MRRLLNKIFRAKGSSGQFVFAGIGFLIGLLLLLISVQVYIQISRILDPKNAYPEYLIISKKIGFATTLTLGRANFTDAEIAELKKQPFIQKVGTFTSNQYEVIAFSSKIKFYSELFFEAIEDEFIDDLPKEWEWEEGDNLLPVIISQDMLDLYNFGYALGKSAGLPQLSRSTAKLVTITVRVQGEKGRKEFNAKVVGFSQRIPSIIVPNSFMKWANKNIGKNVTVQPSRLMLKVTNPSDPKLAEYFKSKNYQINQDKLKASKAGAIVKVVMSVIGVIGLFFIALSFVIFSMSFRVILAEAKEEIRLLLQLGYTVQVLARFLITYFMIFIGLILLFTMGLMYYMIHYLQNFLIDRGLEISTGVEPVVLLVAFIFVGLTILTNILSIIRLLNKYN